MPSHLHLKLNIGNPPQKKPSDISTWEGEENPAASVGSFNCQPAGRTSNFASYSTRRVLWLSALSSYSGSLGWEHAPYRASGGMLFLTRTRKVQIVACSLRVWLWACYVFICTQGNETVPNTNFIDDKMMHLQHSAFGG